MKKGMTPIRILHVMTNMSYGGLENLLMNYYRSIDRQKVQFDFLTHFSQHQDFEEEIRELGGKLYRLPRLNPFSKSYRKALSSFFNEHPEYTIVHSHLDCMSPIVLKAAKQNGVPIRIAHSHTSKQNKDLKYLIKMFYRTRMASTATDFFACGNRAGDWMFGGKPYTVLTNAIDSKSYSYCPRIADEVKKELGIKDETVIGHVGQFRTEKNQLFLVKVFSEIVKLKPDSRLVFVGKGATQQDARQYAQEHGIADKVLFLGARADVARLLQCMDVFVLPSLFEGLPVSLIEAQAAGLPCVVSDRVPPECKKTDLLEWVSLSEPTAVWAERILQAATQPRIDSYREICEAGFDVFMNAEWLQNYYLTKQADGLKER